MKQTKKIGLLLVLISIMLFSIACQKDKKQDTNKEYITKTSFKLNTVVTITIYDKQEEYLLEESMKLCDRYESIFSRTKETSELYQFNHGLLDTDSTERNTAVLSSDLVDLINRGLSYGVLSNGAFDITVAHLAELWNFTGESPSVPSKESIDALLPEIDYTKVTVSDNQVSLDDSSMAMDLGGIAKGYIADRIKEYLKSEGVKSAIINLGGNVLCIGEKPDGSPFHVGIQKPFADRNETIAVMDIRDKSVVSSGIYERFFTQDGKLYHHILNPSTGYPYDTNLVSVTIISDESVDGDGLSTSCFALGLEEGMKLIDSINGVHAVFITSDYELHYSNGFFDDIPVNYAEH